MNIAEYLKMYWLNMIHNFKHSLAIGQQGEAQLLLYMPELTKLDGRKADFINEQTGATYELKTDSYDYNKTANFFIETASDAELGKPGGPWQALEHGSTYWLYMFSRNKVLFTFKTLPLVQWLDTHPKKYPLISIPNKGWTTLGFKLPRVDVAHLYMEKHFE